MYVCVCVCVCVTVYVFVCVCVCVNVYVSKIDRRCIYRIQKCFSSLID